MTFRFSGHVSGFTRELELGVSVVDLIQNQLNHMNTLLAATMLKIGAADNSPGVVVGNQFTPPDVVLEMLQKLSDHATEMSGLLEGLKNEKRLAERKKDLDKESYKKMAIRALLVTSGILIGFFIAKTVRSGKKLI